MKNTTKFISLLLLVFPLFTEATHGVTGTPPSFIQEPEDMVVFATNADMSRASLTLNCNASGDPSPTITWYREGMPLSDDLILASGSLLIVNITEGVDATRGGLSYHCTATNKFGTIRSRAANVSYAYFNGFDGPNETVNVNVTTDRVYEAAVAIECRVRDANPPPVIRWRDANGLLTEDWRNNRLRFLDNGRYLLIRELTTAQLNTTYQCEVTNALLNQLRTSPTTYVLVNNVGANEFITYKRFVNRTVLVGDFVELSHIVSAGRNIIPFGILDCQRSGSTLDSPLHLPIIGGVIDEPIPDTLVGEQIPSVASSVTFEVRCYFIHHAQATRIQTTITVQALPWIVAPLSQDDLEEFVGDSITFICNVTGIPTPTVTWYFNGARLSGGGASRNSLTIAPTTVSHTGMYQCFASNPVGSVQYSWALEVRKAAKPAVSISSSANLTVDSIIGKPLLVAPIVEGQVTLFAVVTADPCPTIQWRWNGSAVSNDTIGNPCSDSPAGTTVFNFTLTITATAVTTGTYSATLTNPAGTANVPDVFVTPPVPVVITELRISSGPRCLLNGTFVDIQCVNSGFPRPEIFFFRGVEQITPGVAPFTHFVQVSFDTMKLLGPQPWDGENYVCEARIGNIQLSLSRPKKLVYCTQPTIVDLPAPPTHTEGDRFELVCSFTGIPAPEIRWEKDGSVLLLGEGRRVINTTGRSQLEINSLTLSDAGVYTCSVSNIADTAARSVRLEVRAMTPRSHPGMSPEVIAGIAVGAMVLIVTLFFIVFSCGVLVAGQFQKSESPAVLFSATEPCLLWCESPVLPFKATEAGQHESPAVPSSPTEPGLLQRESPAVPSSATEPSPLQRQSPAVPSSPTEPGLQHESPAVPSSPTEPGLQHESPAVPSSPTEPGLQCESPAVPSCPTEPSPLQHEIPAVPSSPTEPGLQRESPTVPSSPTEPGLQRESPTVPSSPTEPGLQHESPSSAKEPIPLQRQSPAVPSSTTEIGHSGNIDESHSHDERASEDHQSEEQDESNA